VNLKHALVIILLVLSCSFVHAIFNDYQPSARARAMGNAFTAVADDPTGIFYNPAGLCVTPLSAEIGFAQLYNQPFTELKTGSFAYPLPAKLGALGLGIQMFDVDYEDYALMSEQQLSLAYGYTLLNDVHSTIHVGCSATYYALAMDGYDSDTAYGINLGALAILHERTRFGFSVQNLNQPVMGADNAHSLPRKLAMGVAYMPYDGVITSVELKKDFAQDTEFMGGVEVKLLDPLYIRAGVHQNPATWSGGIGIKMIGVNLDYSYTRPSVLDDTHYLNIGYEFRR